jgi:hypothetical protein
MVPATGLEEALTATGHGAGATVGPLAGAAAVAHTAKKRHGWPGKTEEARRPIRHYRPGERV